MENQGNLVFLKIDFCGIISCEELEFELGLLQNHLVGEQPIGTEFSGRKDFQMQSFVSSLKSYLYSLDSPYMFDRASVV